MNFSKSENKSRVSIFAPPLKTTFEFRGFFSDLSSWKVNFVFRFVQVPGNMKYVRSKGCDILHYSIESRIREEKGVAQQWLCSHKRHLPKTDWTLSVMQLTLCFWQCNFFFSRAKRTSCLGDFYCPLDIFLRQYLRSFS